MRYICYMRFILASVVLILILGGSVFGLSYFMKSRLGSAPKEISLETPVRSEFNTSMTEINFHELGYSSITPAEVDFYLEGSNLKDFLTLVVGTPSETILNKDLSAVYEALFSSLDPRFALLQKGERYGFVFKILDKEKMQVSLDTIKWSEGWGSYLVGDYLLITSHKDFFDEVEKAFKKRIIPLNLDSKFQQSVSRLPKKGMMFLYSPLRLKSAPPKTLESEVLKLIPTQGEGTGFVLSRKTEGTLILMGESK